MLLAAVANGKTVDFVLHRSDKVKNFPNRRNGDFSAIPGNGSGSVAVILYHTEKRNVDPHAVKKFLYRRNMSFAAVQ